MAVPHPRPSALQLIAALPFVVFLFILPFPGTVALRLICLIAMALVAAYHWRRLADLPLRWPILFWAAVVLGSLLTAVDPAYSWREIKNEVGYSLVAFAAFFAWARGRRELGIALAGLAAGFIVISVGAIFHKATIGVWPSTAFYGGAGSASAYLAACGPVLLIAGFLWSPRHARWWAACAGSLLMVAVAISEQRILWPVIGLQACLFVYWAWHSVRLEKNDPRRRGMLLVGTLLLVVLGAGFVQTQQNRAAVGEGKAIKEIEFSGDPRPAVWTGAMERILGRPLTGAGFGRRAMTKAYPELVPADFPLMWHTHNLVLNYGISAGIPGMAAILLLFGAFGWRFWRLARRGELRERLVALAGAAMVLGVFARNMVNDFFVRDGALLFWALAGMLLGYLLRPQLREVAA